MLATPARRILRGIYLTFDTGYAVLITRHQNGTARTMTKDTDIASEVLFDVHLYTFYYSYSLCASHYSAITRAFCNVNTDVTSSRVCIMRRGDRKRH